MKSIKIPIHSFVAEITNSSSEVYVTSDRQTLTTFKDLIDSILEAADSHKRCNDLFELSLEEVEGGYGNYKNIVATPKSKDALSEKAAQAISEISAAFQAETIGND